MLRKVRTAYGASDDFHTSVGEDLMHGECQGKKSSLRSWAIYTITLICDLGKFNKGITVSCVEGIMEVTCLDDIFVDDKDMWTASRKVEHDDHRASLLQFP